MTERRLSIRRPSGWLACALAIITLAAGATVFVRSVTPQRYALTMMAGDPATTRALIGHLLVSALERRGVQARLAAPLPLDVALDELNAGTIDLLLAPSALEFEGHPHIVEATPLYFEVLHLAVKSEFVEAVTSDLGALRGRTVDVGPLGSTNARLAEEVLSFAQGGLGAGPPPVLQNLSAPELSGLLDAGDRTALPDAVFHLSMVPSVTIERLVRGAAYRLVPLAFADAFRLEGILTEGQAHRPLSIDRADVYEAIVPPFVYQTAPPVPASALPTLGTRLLLLVNERAPATAVTALLDAVFTSPFARLSHPPLSDDVLSQPTRIALHAGTLAYIARNRPYISDDRVDELSNALSIVGALGGSALFMWQWRRQRTQRAREELFTGYLRRLADVSRRVADVELAADLELEPLAAAQRGLLELKAEVLDDIVAGELTEMQAVSALMMPIDAAVDHVADLILHVRENVEEQAEAEGRSVEAVWTEALEGGEETKTPPPAE